MTKRELVAVRRITYEIRRQEEYLIGLRELMASMELQMQSGRSSATSRRVEILTLKIIAAEERLQWLLERLDAAKVDLQIQITKETYDPLKRILILRYVACWTWTRISKDTGLSRQWIYALHKKYLATLALHVKS